METEYIWMTGTQVCGGVCACVFVLCHAPPSLPPINCAHSTPPKSRSVLTGFVTFFTFSDVIDWQEENRRRKIDVEGMPPEDAQYDEVDTVLDALDSVGLAAFAIIGAQNGVRAGTSLVVSSICGMCTSTFGGMLRDLLCGRPVRIVHSNAEVYAQPALAGAVTYLLANRMGATPAVKIGSAMACCMGSRFLAIKHDVKLATWDTKDDGLGVAVRKRPTTKAIHS